MTEPRFADGCSLARRVAIAALAAMAVAMLLIPAGAGGAAANEELQTFPFMQPDEETLRGWIAAYDSAPRLESVRASATLPAAYLDLLEHLDYVPSQNSQGACGNCWAWAGTSALGIALDVQKGIHDRLSVQFINSCQQRECCRGGWLADFARFYDSTGFCIPWSNDGAYWQDGTHSCTTSCGAISTRPSYAITHISDLTVPTRTGEGVTSREAAIRNIKSALNQNRAVWFAFFVPSPAAWQQFTSFWLNQGESTTFALDSICAGTTSYAGHAVLCVGYNDTDPNNRYWIMLNSWGTAGGRRPNGLFRINMDMEYNTRCGIPAFYWQVLDVGFGAQPKLAVYPDSLECSVIQFSTVETMFSISNDGDGQLLYDAVSSDPEGSGGTTIEFACDDDSAESGYAGAAGSRSAVRVIPPSCPSRLETASVFLRETGTPWPDGSVVDFVIEVYAADGTGGLPGTLLGGTTGEASGFGWRNIDLSALDITTTAQDLYIAFHFVDDAPEHFSIGFDESDPSGRSYWRESGGPWLPVEDAAMGSGDWLIRAAALTLESAWVSTTPSNGTVAPGSSQNVAVTIDSGSLRAGEQVASIYVGSNDLTANPTVLPVTVTVLPAADLVPVILCATWDDIDAGEYTITCAVANNAFGTAGASTAKLYVDVLLVKTEEVPELGPGASYSFTQGSVTLSDDSDSLVLTVNPNDAVYPESDESNNEASLTVATPAPATVELSLAAGWNMVSVPLVLDDARTATVFPNVQAVYTWNSDRKTYESPALIEHWRSYWVFVTQPTPVTASGLKVTCYVRELSAGWHMLGSVYGTTASISPPRAAPTDGVLPLAYRWDPGEKTYVSSTTLEEGFGYWVAATQDCLLQVS